MKFLFSLLFFIVARCHFRAVDDDLDDLDDLMPGGGGGAALAVKRLGESISKGLGKVVEAVKGQRTQLEKVEQHMTLQQKTLTELDQWSKDGKKAMGDLQLAVNKSNDLEIQIKALKKALQAIETESKLNWDDPISKALHTEERKVFINAIARQLCHYNLTEKHQKALTGESGVGATLIDSGFEKDMYNLLSTYGKWSTLGVRQIGKSTTSYPVKTARPVAKFFRKIAGRKLPEDGNKAGTRASVTVEAMGALLVAEEELLKDSEIDLSADIMNDFVEAMNFLLDYMAFMADGTDDDANGGFTGVFNAGTAVYAAATHTTIELMGYGDFLKCLTGVPPIVLQKQAKWWTHPYNLALALNIKDASGRPIFQTALEAPSFGAVGSILGYPLELIHVGPNTNAADSPTFAFGDPQNQLVPIYQGFEFDESKDWKFDDYSRAFRVVARAATATRLATGFSILNTAAA